MRVAPPAVVAILALLSACTSSSHPSPGRMIHQAISGPEMPRALGPYSHVIRAGDLLFISGQPGLDPETGEVPQSFEAQARLAFDNLSRVLRASGSGMEHVVKTTVFLSDPSAFAAMNQLYQEFFPSKPPARSTPIVQLPRGLLISIEAIAIAPPRQ